MSIGPIKIKKIIIPTNISDLSIKKTESNNNNLNGTGKIFEEVTSGFKELIFERLYGGNDTDGIKIKVFLKIAVKST